MIRDLYCRIPTDTKYNWKAISTTDEVERMLQQIRVILGTKNGEVLGDPNFGCDLSDYVFQYGVRKEEILNQVRSHILQYLYYDPEKWDIDFDINYGKNLEDRTDYAILDIIINGIKYLGIIVE